MPAQTPPLRSPAQGSQTRVKDYVLTDGDGFSSEYGQRLDAVEFQLPRTGDQEPHQHGLGTYPELSLANARKKAVEASELLAQGIDPKVQRNAE
jgi:hypothetical protein